MPFRRSTKELTKAINAFIPSATLPLPEDLSRVIEGYLEKHAEYDQGASERLQEELLSIYHKSVQDQPARYAAFLAILRRLRPAVRSPAHILLWWDKLVEPVVESLSREKGLAHEALANVESLLIYDGDDEQGDGDGVSSPIANRLLEKWMDVVQDAQLEGNSSASYKEKLLRETVLLFGKKKPKVGDNSTIRKADTR